MADVAELVRAAIKERDKRAIARVLTLIESDPEVLRPYYRELFGAPPKSFVVGLTGPPGVGKSTLINRLIKELRSRGKSVAVIAIDPASPLSGGSLLGDRVRVRDLDEGTFFRSMSTPPNEDFPWKVILGLEFLNSIGFDYVLIEHPGSGQINVKISDLVDVLLVILQPLTGDDIQVLKAGITELGDIYVINKSDLPQSTMFFRIVESVVSKAPGRDSVSPKVIMVSAISGSGVPELVDSIEGLISWGLKSGVIERRRVRRRVKEVYCLGLTYVKLLYDDVFREFERGLPRKVISGESDIMSVGEEVFREFLSRSCSVSKSLLGGGGD